MTIKFKNLKKPPKHFNKKMNHNVETFLPLSPPSSYPPFLSPFHPLPFSHLPSLRPSKDPPGAGNGGSETVTSIRGCTEETDGPGHLRGGRDERMRKWRRRGKTYIHKHTDSLSVCAGFPLSLFRSLSFP